MSHISSHVSCLVGIYLILTCLQILLAPQSSTSATIPLTSTRSAHVFQSGGIREDEQSIGDGDQDADADADADDDYIEDFDETLKAPPPTQLLRSLSKAFIS